MSSYPLGPQCSHLPLPRKIGEVGHSDIHSQMSCGDTCTFMGNVGESRALTPPKYIPTMEVQALATGHIEAALGPGGLREGA